VPPGDAMNAAVRLAFRLDPRGNLFYNYPANELWNGSSRGHQSEF
jgi:hypothetical protein